MNNPHRSFFAGGFLFFIFGLVSLMSEVAWQRMLIVALGSTTLATSLVVMVFMAGIGAGSFWGGRFFQKRVVSWRLFLLIQFILGCYIFLSPHFFHALFRYVLLYISLGEAPVYLTFIRCLFGVLFLGLPTFLMGAAFPALVAIVSFQAGDKAARVGYLYGLNTLGAAAGCFLSGYVLLPRLGVLGTLLAAALVSFITVAAGFYFGENKKGAGDGVAAADISAQIAPGVKGGYFSSAMLCGMVFLSGFVGLAYEVLLVRVLIVQLGNVNAAFSVVVAAFLAAVGLGAGGWTWLDKRLRRAGCLFPFVFAGAGLGMAFSPLLLLKIKALFPAGVWPAFFYDGMIMAIILIPVLFLAGIFPLSLQVIQEKNSNPSLSFGRLYGWNTLGGVLGAGLINSVFVRYGGTQGTLAAFSSIFLAIAFMFAWKAWRRKMAMAFGVFCLAAGMVSLKTPSVLERFYLKTLGLQAPRAELFHEGAAATVTVVDEAGEGRLLFINGVEEVSTRFYHVQLFKMLGILPVIYEERPAAKDVLMIAFGAGVSAGAVLDTGAARTLEVVDIVPEAEKINEYFKEVNGDVYHRPGFRFIAEDGRNYLLRSRKKYDVIIADATHPYAHDSWPLYSDEFYASVKSHLAPGGVFAQWLPLSISDEFFRIYLRTVSQVFPYWSFWNIYGSDQAFLMATTQPFRFDPVGLQARLDQVSPGARLADFGLNRAVDWTAFFVMTQEEARPLLRGEFRLNTDNLSYNEQFDLDRKPGAPFSTVRLVECQSDLGPYLNPDARIVREDIRRKQVLARAMRRFFRYADVEALHEAYLIDPRDKLVTYFSGERMDIFPRLTMQEEQQEREQARMIERKITALLAKTRRRPGQWKNYFLLGEIYLMSGQPEEARRWLAKALELAPRSLPVIRQMAAVEMLLENWREAERLLNLLQSRRPNDFFVLSQLLHVYENTGDVLVQARILESLDFKRTPWQGHMRYKYFEFLAKTYYALDRFTDAERSALKSLEYYSSNPVAHRFLAHIYRRAGNPDKALGHLRAILDVNPYHLWALESSIVFFQERGEREKAAEFIRRFEEAKGLSPHLSPPP